jgi:hypothetical protein
MVWSALPLSPDPSQTDLRIFDTWAEVNCPLYEDCGCGSTAPCGCIRVDPERRYQCGDCSIICLERRQPPYGRDAERAANTIIREGESLARVRTGPSAAPEFPVLIPTRTNELPTTHRLDLAWVAMDLKQLLRLSSDGSVRSRIAKYDPDRLRGMLRVQPQTQVVAALNGADHLLEGFWSMPRREFYEDAVRANLSWFTGPTFSVVQEGSETPASHNIAMLRRHHRVVKEIGGTALSVAPNLYWRDRRGRNRWVEWLCENRQLEVISRDFSRSKASGPFRDHLKGLVDIVRRVDRPLHVLLVGIGPTNGGTAIRRLAEVGATCSIVTAHPIASAVYGGHRLRETPSGDLIRVPGRDISRMDLIGPNLTAMEDHLLHVVRDLPGYRVDGINKLAPHTADTTPMENSST